MELNLEIGQETASTYTVDESMSPPHLQAMVLSTPAMIAMMEGACLQAVQSALPDGHTTVGTHVNVSHTGPAFAGEDVTVKVVLAKIEKRRLTFEIEVLSPRGSISTGSHQRAVVDLARFA